MKNSLLTNIRPSLGRGLGVGLFLSLFTFQSAMSQDSLGIDMENGVLGTSESQETRVRVFVDTRHIVVGGGTIG